MGRWDGGEEYGGVGGVRRWGGVGMLGARGGNLGEIVEAGWCQDWGSLKMRSFLI